VALIGIPATGTDDALVIAGASVKGRKQMKIKDLPALL
jgi:hypothetical protein